MMFLITGCGRSGTKYAATLLRRAGLDVGHERWGADGIVSAHYAVDDDRYPRYHRQGVRPAFDVVLHQVREPLATIASLQTSNSWPWVCRHLPVDPSAPLLKLCAHNWLVFNEAAERQAAFTYRVEAIREAWGRICELIGCNAPFPQGLPTNINARQHGAVSWAQVQDAAPEIYNAIRAAAARYGYGGT